MKLFVLGELAWLPEKIQGIFFYVFQWLISEDSKCMASQQCIIPYKEGCVIVEEKEKWDKKLG